MAPLETLLDPRAVFAGRHARFVDAWGSHHGTCLHDVAYLVWSTNGATVSGCDCETGASTTWDAATGAVLATDPNASRPADASRAPHDPLVTLSRDRRRYFRPAFGPIFLPDSLLDLWAPVRAAGPPHFSVFDAASSALLWSADDAEPFAFSPRGDFVVGVAFEGELAGVARPRATSVVIWGAERGDVVASFAWSRPDAPVALAVDGNGEQVFFVDAQRGIGRLELPTGAVRWSHGGHPSFRAHDEHGGFDRPFRSVESLVVDALGLLVVGDNKSEGSVLSAWSTADGVERWRATLPRRWRYPDSPLPFEPSIAVAPEERRFAIAHGYFASTALRVVRTASGAVESFAHGHDAPVVAIAPSVDGRLVASGDAGGVIRVYAIGERHPVWVLEGHAASVSSLAFTPGGLSLLSASHDGTVRRWSLKGGGEEDRWVERGPCGEPASIVSLALSADAALALLTIDARFDGPVALYDAARGVRRWRASLGDIDGTSRWWFGSQGHIGDGKAFACGGALAFAFDLATGRPTRLYDNTPGASAALRADGAARLYAVASRGQVPFGVGSTGAGDFALWRLDTGAPQAAFRVREAVRPPRVTIAGDVRSFAIASGSNVSLVALGRSWLRLRPGAVETLDFAAIDDVPQSVALSGDGRRLFVGTARGLVFAAAWPDDDEAL